MKTFTTYAEKKAKQFLNLLQGYTKGIRMTAILILLLMGVNNAWGANGTISGGGIIYLNSGGTTYWDNDNAWFSVYFMDANKSTTKFVSMTKVTGNYYYATVPTGTWKYVIFVRNNPADKTADWTNVWNQTADLYTQSDKNLYTITGWNGNDGSWGTYQPTATGSLVASSSTNVAKNTNITLTPSISPTTYNVLKSTSYSISPSSGATISNNTFKATAGGSYTVTATITYNAKGFTNITTTVTATTTITVKPTITFNANGGSGSMSAQTVSYNTNTTLSANTFTAPVGYTFNGWNTKTDGTGTAYAAGTSYKFTSDLTLYAQWKINTYTVSYGVCSSTRWGSIKLNSETAITTTGTKTLNYGTDISFTATPNTGYQVVGWYSNADCTTQLQAGGNSYNAGTLTANKTVYVKYEPIPETKYVVTISAGANGSVRPSGEQQVGASGIDIAATANTGYQFTNWETTGGASIANANSASTTVTATAAGTATANFTEILYAITVKSANNNHGTVTQSTDKAGIATTMVITASPKPGYEFVNWTADNGITLDDANSATTTITKATATGTVTANFQEKKHNVTVSYKYGDITIKDNTTTSDVGEVTSTNITAPTIAGYTFSSWTLETGITNKSANTTTNPISITTNSSGTYTLTANYEEDLSTGWYLAGEFSNNGDSDTGWNANKIEFTKLSGQSTGSVSYITMELLPTTFTDDYLMSFKIVNGSNWYGNNGTYKKASNNQQQWQFEKNKNNCQLEVSLPGTYTFRLQSDSTNSTKYISITYPVVNQLQVYSATPSHNEATKNWNWDTHNGDVYSKTLSLNANTKYEFKAVVNSDFYGKNDTKLARKNQSVTLNTDGGDVTITTDVAGDYTFTFNGSNKSLTVTYPEAYKVTFSKGTGGKTVTAKVDGVAITSGDYVLKGKSVVFTQEAATGYTFSKWTNGSSTTLSTDPSYTCTVNADVTVKAEFTENTTKVTIDANDGSLGTLKVGDAAQSWGYSTSVGVATTKSIVATPKDNSYEFTGWTLTGNVTTSDDTKNTTITIKGNGNSGLGTVTANFQKIVRTITFDQEGGEDGTETLNAIYGEATTQITTPTKTGYIFGGYWTGDNGTGTQIVNTDGTWIASIANFTDANNKWIVTSDKTLYAKWEENLSTITIKTSPEGAGTLKVGGSNFTAGNTTTVGITTSRTVVASNTDGFTFKEWQKSDNITITEGSLTSPSITIKGNGNGGAGTLTAVYDEDLSTPYVFIGGTAFGGDDWKTEYPLTKRPGESNVKIGYVTFNITGINSDGGKRAYQFKIKKGDIWYGLPAGGNWWYKREHSTEAMSLSSTAGDIGLITDMAGAYTIKVDYTNENDPKLTVSYPSTEFYLLGFGNANSYWEEDESKKFSVDAGIATITKTLTAGTHEFKIEEKVNNDEIWRTSSTTITRANNTNIDFSNTSSDAANAKITADVAGTYTFTYDIVNQKLTVIYPSKLTLTDGPATSVSSAMTSNPLTTVPGQMVTATPTMDIGANGNTLCWKLYDKDQDINNLDETVDVNFISLGNGKITFELPKVTGTYYLQLTIHAGADCSDETLIETIICPINVSTENTVFFQDESGKWKNVYVYFYGEGGYWEDAYGSGATNITSHKMTRINGTNIFYYKYSFDISSKNIAFTDHDQAGYQWFSSCQVVYRSDFDDCVPMFVLDKNHGVNRNTTAYYYTDGYWTTYMGTSSGYWLHIDGNGVADPSHEMTTTTVGKRVYTHKVSLNGNQNPYNLWFGGCNGTNYGVESDMTVTNCTEWNLYAGPASVNLHATASGDYTFILYCNPDGHFQLSVEFPVAKGDFQLIYDDEQQNPHPSDYIRSSTIDGKSDTVSMYIRGENGTGKTLKVQRCTGFNNGNPQWETLKTYDDDEFLGLNLTKDTVYNFHMEQTVSDKTIAIKGTEFYSGKYYVRTKAADGGWDAYATEADNQMTYTEYSSHLPFDPYTHYFCKWVDDSNKDDVSYTVACDYAKALSDTLEGDNYTKTPESHALPEKANVRFTYDNRTNGLKRAYLTGASDSDFDDFLKLTKTKDGTTMKPGKNASDVSHVKLKDEENWVYATEIYVTSGGSFDAMLTAVYPKSAVDNPAKKQYFFAKKNNDGTYAGETLIGGTDGSEQLVTIRYDFKTNRLMRAWKPSGEIDDEELPLSADILLIREGQNAAEQLVFLDPTANKITDVKTIFGALEFKYDNMVGKLGTGNWDKTSYHYCRYYVSFPFDVRISEIFGAGNYGEDYIIQKYNGTKRAEIGWFAETETFWETMDKSEKLNKYEGYCVMLNRTPFNDGNSHVWKNKKAGGSVYLYFPSASHKDDWTINAIGDVVIAIPEHKCNIDRDFTQDVRDGKNPPRNHKNTDSHWNMVGTPLFQNATAAKIADGPEVEEGDGHAEPGTRLQYVYDWVNTAEIPNGTAARKAWGTDFEFKAMHSYLIQFAGEVSFQGSHIANHVPSAIAARRAAEEVKNYTVELQLDRDSAFASRTYVELQENAEDGFLLNEDMYMGSSSPIANLYTYAGAYDVAANVLSVNSHIVPVGVQVKKAGTYTFSMTTPFDGTVTLIDYHTGARTNLGWSNYTITLEKGTINDRFALEINIQHVSTDVEGNTGNFKGKDGVKFLHNGILYIKKGDTIYDARGSKVSMSYEL